MQAVSDGRHFIVHRGVRVLPPERYGPVRSRSLPRISCGNASKGEIDLIFTDHAPPLDQKFGSDKWDCPFGSPGVETTLTMLLNATAEHRLTLEGSFERTAKRPPTQYLSRKGTICPGSDADIVLARS